jgi:hypothetical protein
LPQLSSLHHPACGAKSVLPFSPQPHQAFAGPMPEPGWAAH